MFFIRVKSKQKHKKNKTHKILNIKQASKNKNYGIKTSKKKKTTMRIKISQKKKLA